jgi:hypothetical protein
MEGYFMKNILLGFIFLVGMSCSQCLAWTVMGVRNDLNDDVTVSFVLDRDISVRLGTVYAHTYSDSLQDEYRSSFLAIDCPSYDVIDNNQSYLLVAVGDKRFAISTGSLLGRPYAIWVWEILSNPNFSVFEPYEGRFVKKISVPKIKSPLEMYVLKLKLTASGNNIKFRLENFELK